MLDVDALGNAVPLSVVAWYTALKVSGSLRLKLDCKNILGMASTSIFNLSEINIFF